jgi:hypothetical protein
VSDEVVPHIQRKSIAFFNTESAHVARQSGSHYWYMFVEDVRLHIMPVGGHSSAHGNFAVELLPDTQELRRTLGRVFLGRDRYRFSSWDPFPSAITQTISDFISDTASILVSRGVAHFEIVRESLPQRQPRTAAAKSPERSDNEIFFCPAIIPGTVVRIPGFYVQRVPRNEWARTGMKAVLLPARTVWTLRIPLELGGPRRHIKLLDTLVKSSQPLPNFVIQSMMHGEETPSFSHRDFNRQQLQTVARATRSWGWPARDLWSNHVLRYSNVERHVRFARSMAILRDYLLESMNHFLQRTGYDIQLSVNGLPSRSEIDGYLTKLENGQVTSEKILKAVRF